MFIFFTFITTVFFLSSWYVYSHGVTALKGSGILTCFKWTYWIIAATFIVGQALERGEPLLISKIVSHIGSIWLSVFLYLFLFVLVTDIVRLIHYIYPFFPDRIFPSLNNGLLLFYTAIIISFAITIYGFINARNAGVTRISINSEKRITGYNKLKIVMVSDVHIGAMLGKPRVEEMIEKINGLKPDIVIFAGDLVDHNPRFLIAGKMGDAFLKLKAPLGIYAVAGNHEFIGNAEKSIEYLSQFGIIYLRDTLTDLGNGIQIAGRDDRDKIRFDGIARKKLSEVLKNFDSEKFTILIDHQPVDYKLVKESGVDLMLSGHTHKGQLWPFNFITDAIYPNHYGLFTDGSTNYYTSSGYGTWGPPVRTGNRPEIVEITISF